LKEDVDNSLHDVLSPKELWETRQDYRMFDLNTFCNHIYQEVRQRKTSAYWLHKQEEAKKEAEEIDVKYIILIAIIHAIKFNIT
jgi:hypothetical protein